MTKSEARKARKAGLILSRPATPARTLPAYSYSRAPLSAKARRALADAFDSGRPMDEPGEDGRDS
jgi:hypothetical protein